MPNLRITGITGSYAACNGLYVPTNWWLHSRPEFRHTECNILDQYGEYGGNRLHLHADQTWRLLWQNPEQPTEPSVLAMQCVGKGWALPTEAKTWLVDQSGSGTCIAAPEVSVTVEVRAATLGL